MSISRLYTFNSDASAVRKYWRVKHGKAKFGIENRHPTAWFDRFSRVNLSSFRRLRSSSSGSLGFNCGQASRGVQDGSTRWLRFRIENMSNIPSMFSCCSALAIALEQVYRCWGNRNASKRIRENLISVARFSYLLPFTSNTLKCLAHRIQIPTRYLQNPPRPLKQ